MTTDNFEDEGRVTEHFDFGTSAADMIIVNKKRNVRSEVTNRGGFDPQEVIDTFEQAKGIKRKPTAAQQLEDYEYKNIILDPEETKDQEMLNELMNNKKYSIVMWKDTWTMQGSFRVFAIYGAKKEKAKEEDKNNE